MKSLFKKINWIGVLAVLAVTLVIFTQSAFKSAFKQDETAYYFNGLNSSNIQDPEDWALAPEFSCNRSGTLPCQINVPSDQTLEEYLEAHTPTEIVANSTSKRP